MTTDAAYVVTAQPGDSAWITDLYNEDEQYGGALGWWRYQQRTRPDFHARATGEHFWVIQPQRGFVHWRMRADGVRVVDGLAVSPGRRREGIGTYLMSLVGRPLEIKVLTTATCARAFCLAVGLQPMAKIPSKSGARMFMLFRGD